MKKHDQPEEEDPDDWRQQALFGEVLIDPEVLRQLFYGLALVLVMLLRPQGIWPARHQGAKA